MNKKTAEETIRDMVQSVHEEYVGTLRKTCNVDDTWVYRRLPLCTEELFYKLLETIGNEHFKLPVHTITPEGNHMGDMLISPTGMVNLTQAYKQETES